MGQYLRKVNGFYIFVSMKDTEMNEVMVAPDGIEPPTQGFSILCSTN